MGCPRDLLGIVPQTFEPEPGDEGDLEGRTCLAKDGKFTLLPASLVDVSLRWHYGLGLME